MTKVAQRLLTFFIGIPIVLGIVFIDYWNHLPVNALVCIVSAFAADELYKMFRKKTPLLNRKLVITLSCAMPLIEYLTIILNNAFSGIEYSTWAFLIAAMILMGCEAFCHKTFEDSNSRLAGSVFIVFYCGFLLTFITRITLFKKSTVFLGLFLFTVFMNDSLAWLFGVLFGKNNRNVFAASPNKSMAGFAGGIFGAIASCVAARYIWPEIFTGPVYFAVILGFLSAIAAITGDLIESVFKRSSEIKDSGNIIPGRGGILDCIDSIVFSAPIFYVASYFLFHPEIIGSR